MSMRSSNVQTWRAWPAMESPRWNLATLLAILIAGGALATSWHIAQIEPSVLFGVQGRRHIWAFLMGLFPPELSATFLRLLLVPTIETIQISIMGTTLAIMLGFRWRFWLRIACVSPVSSTRWMETLPAGAV